MQVGVVSWGQGCSRPKAPGVYAKVSSAYTWINEQICTHSRQPPSELCNPAGNEAILGAIERGDERHTIQIDIKMDAYPRQVGWMLINNDVGSIIDRMDYGSARVPFQELNLKYNDLIPGNYTFLVMDVKGDGICCQLGIGYILISELREDGSSSLIWAENGDFGGGTQKTFELKAPER